MFSDQDLVDHLPVTSSIHNTQRSKIADILLQYCKDGRYLFADKQFPSNSASLYQNPPHPDYRPAQQKWNFGWNRPKDILYNYKLFANEPTPCDILQGYLGDCYLLCAISALAEQPSLIKRLFYFTETNEHGVIGIWLFINGKWQLEIIDEYFPTTPDASGKKGFAFSRTKESELWVMAIEKAYAKAYGSYFDIVGGCPYWSLRELTGAPFEIIDDMSNPNQLWNKISDAVTKNWVMGCSSISGKSVESKLREGIATSHAYSILHAVEVKDSRGRLRRIIKVRNPWGHFEWNGEFSDNSSSWTPQLKQKLNVKAVEDGIFWMPWEEFCRFYAEISILKVQPGYVNNAVHVKRVDKMEQTIIRMSLNKKRKTHVFLSIDQIDSRIIDKQDYQYSFFRITLARIHENDTLDFIAYSFSCDRNIFLEDNLDPGVYIILIEVYWTSPHPDKYTFGTYSDTQIDLEILSCAPGAYTSAEHMMWQSFAAKHRDQMKFLRNSPGYTRKEKPPMEMRLFNDPQSGLALYAYYNKGEGGYAEKVSVTFETKFTREIVAAVVAPGKAEIYCNPGDVGILLRKADRSRQIQGAPFSLVPGKQEIVGKPFQVDRHTIELLKPPAATYISGQNNQQGFLMDRVTTGERDMEDKLEKQREMVILAHKFATEKHKEEIRKFQMEITGLLEDFGAVTSQQENLKIQGQGSQFFIISESIRNVKVPDYNNFFGGRDEVNIATKRSSSTKPYIQSDRFGNSQGQWWKFLNYQR